MVAPVDLALAMSAWVPVLHSAGGGWGWNDASNPKKHLRRCLLCCITVGQVALATISAAGPCLPFFLPGARRLHHLVALLGLQAHQSLLGEGLELVEQDGPLRKAEVGQQLPAALLQRHCHAHFEVPGCRCQGVALYLRLPKTVTSKCPVTEPNTTSRCPF